MKTALQVFVMALAAGWAFNAAVDTAEAQPAPAPASAEGQRAGRPMVAGPPPAVDRYVLIHAGTLLAVPGKSPSREMTVIVKNDRIERVANGYLDAAASGAGGAEQVADLGALLYCRDSRTHHPAPARAFARKAAG